MPSRVFTDEYGVPWTVWAVEPTFAERRLGQDRRAREIEEQNRADIEHALNERRSGGDRRAGQRDVTPRFKVAPQLTGGWLAFQSKSERRRLVPIPPGWLEASDAELSGLLARATVLPRRGRFIE